MGHLGGEGVAEFVGGEVYPDLSLQAVNFISDHKIAAYVQGQGHRRGGAGRD